MFKLLKKCIVLMVVLSLVVTNISFLYIVTYAEVKEAYVRGTGVNVRKGGSTSYDVIGQVTVGDKITITGSTTDSAKYTWYQIDFGGKTGYIRSDYVYLPKQYEYDADFENKLTRQNFPEDYKEYLRLLHAEYPLWEFEAFNTGYDFDYVVDAENEGARSLVAVGSISSYKSTDEGKYDYVTSTWPTFDGKAWVCASKDVIRYYMDPRNFLIEPYVFQYEKQTFDSSIHTLEGVNEMVKGTFLDGTIKTTGNVDKLINVYTDNNQSAVVNYTDGETEYNNSPPVAPVVTEDQGPGMNFNNPYNSGRIVVPPNNIPPSNATPDGSTIDSSVQKKMVPSVTGPGINYEQTDINGNVIPILYDIDKDKVIAFAETIYGPGVTVQNVIAPNAEEEYVESSYYFTYLPAGDHTYAEIIFDACRQVNISPYVVVSMILQEIGVDGKSDLISGTKTNYKNLYNFGSIGAYASGGKTAIENGLEYAGTEGTYNRPWNTKEKGLYGIIDYYAHSFIKRGQDTFYLKKWNVQGNNAFKHQYMTNVLAAAQEGQILSKAYDDDLRHKKHIMKIPIYKNMPLERCEKPTKDGSPNNKLKELKVDGYTLTPTFDKDIYNYTLIVPENTASIKVSATKYNTKAAVSGTGNVPLTTTMTTVIIKVAAENGDIREYNIMVYTPGAMNNQNMTNQNQMQDTPLIIPDVETNNTASSSGYVISPPISNPISNNVIIPKVIGPGEMIYGTLNQ